MSSRRNRALRVGGAAAFAVVALIVAGCGSSSSSSSSANAAAGSSPSASGQSIKTATGSHGPYLIGPSGRALYLWVADSHDRSVCSGTCARYWPPLTTKGSPVAAHGVNASDLGTISRSGGVKQVTYKGHPLYYFVADSSAGMTKGEGNNGFGAKWWLVSPAGSAITSALAAASSSSSGSSNGSGGGGY